MAPVSLVVPENVPRNFLDLAVEEGLVDIVYPTDPHASFDRVVGSCACDTRDKLGIRGRTVVVKKNHHRALAFPCYALPDDCTFEETYVIVTWLVRNRLKSFRTRIVNGSLHRTVDSNFWFVVESTPDGCCDSFVLENDPVFFLRRIVLSPYGRGPVLESVLQNKVP